MSQPTEPIAVPSPESQHRLPRVVIVGRPNVGKSTLFNRLIGERVAVVQEKPGVTRDRIYHDCDWHGVRFVLVDTGGILFDDEEPLTAQIRLQAEVAIAEADVVLFMADATAGVLPADMELADEMRKLPQPVLVVGNKADHPVHDAWAAEFYGLGFEQVFPVSALHARGIDEVCDRVVELLPTRVEGAPAEDAPVRIAIVGRPNVGKSSLLNAVAGEERAIVSEIPGTTRDALDTTVTVDDEEIVLVDTAGIRRRGKVQGSVEYYMALRAQQAIDRSDVAALVVDGHDGLTAGDKRIGKAAYDAGRACVIVVNKWDLVEPPDGRPKKRSKPKLEFTQKIRDEFPQLAFAPVCFVSATEGTGLKAAIHTCIDVLNSYRLRVSTSGLNRTLSEAVYEKPLTTKGKNLRIYYGTQVATGPPTFVLFCNDPERIHFSYRRYLENRLRDRFPLEGTPIRMRFKSSHERKQA